MPQLEIRQALKDLLAGAFFILFGLAFVIGALGYTVGTPLRMGPGYFPLALGIALLVLGGVIAVKGFVAGEGEPVGGIALRPVILIVAAFLFFGIAVRGLGVVPTLFVTVLVAALARERTGPLGALLTAIGLTVASVLIFIVALQLRVPLWGTWLPF
jgi:Tripartite tricarboxylate transporter TctB family